MKRRFGIAGLAVMGLIVVLGALGIGYGLWSKTLTVNAHVNTGDVNAALSASATNPVVSYDPSNPNPANTNMALPAATTCGESWDGDNLVVTFNNAFPYVCCRAAFDVHNTGTIPIELETPVATQLNGNGGDLTITTCNTDGGYIGPNVGNPSGLEPILGVSGAASTTNCFVQLCVNEQAAQDANYLASVVVGAHQYNEEENPEGAPLP